MNTSALCPKTPHNKPCHCRQGSQEFAEADE